MKYQDFSLTLAQNRVELCGEKALYLPHSHTIIVSDLHFGKAAHFRKNGIGVPDQPDEENLRRLSDLILRKQAKKIIFSGDAFHSDANISLSLFAMWRSHFAAIEMILVKGNHDILKPSAYLLLGLDVIPHRLVIKNLEIVHKPEDANTIESSNYALAGHLHPGISLQGRGRQSIQLACFWQGKTVGVLPAFGSFTGLCMVQPMPGDQVYAFAEGRIVQIPVPVAE